MRLIKTVQRLEGAAAMALETEAPAIAVCWSRHDVRVDAATLLPGEYIAVDMRLGDELQGAQLVVLTERVTCDAGDLGRVYDSNGAVVGRVTEIDGSLLTYEFAPDGPAQLGG